MEFRYHPIIEELKVNEDGTEIYFNESLLLPFANDKNRLNPTIKVNFNSKGHSVTRLVCECWNGLSQHIGQRASKIDPSLGNHYSNLEWKEGASNGVAIFLQKIKPEQHDDILELIESKMPVIKIAKLYDVDSATIYRIKKKYGKEN